MHLHNVDDATLADFEDFLIQDKTNEELDEALSSSSIARYARGPFMFWEERDRLAAAGYSTMPGLPWPGESPHSVGSRLAKAALGQIQPIPREILVPLLNRAEWFLEGPASDLIEITRYLSSEIPAARSAAGVIKVVKHASDAMWSRRSSSPASMSPDRGMGL
jgi:hypothetical protein